MGMVPPRILKPRAKPDFSLLKGGRAYQPYRASPEQNPPQSVSGIIPWGVTMEQAAAALTLLAGVSPTQHEPIGDSGDGIKPCGYEEL